MKEFIRRSPLFRTEILGNCLIHPDTSWYILSLTCTSKFVCVDFWGLNTGPMSEWSGMLQVLGRDWTLQLRGIGILWYFGRESNISKHSSTASFSFCLALPPDVDSGAMMASTGLDTKRNGARKEWPLKTIHQTPNSSPKKIALRGSWEDEYHYSWFIAHDLTDWFHPHLCELVTQTRRPTGSIRPDSIESSTGTSNRLFRPFLCKRPLDENLRFWWKKKRPGKTTRQLQGDHQARKNNARKETTAAPRSGKKPTLLVADMLLGQIQWFKNDSLSGGRAETRFTHSNKTWFRLFLSLVGNQHSTRSFNPTSCLKSKDHSQGQGCCGCGASMYILVTGIGSLGAHQWIPNAHTFHLRSAVAMNKTVTNQCH